MPLLVPASKTGSQEVSERVEHLPPIAGVLGAMRFDGNQPMTNVVAMPNRAAEFLDCAGRLARGLGRV